MSRFVPTKTSIKGEVKVNVMHKCGQLFFFNNQMLCVEQKIIRTFFSKKKKKMQNRENLSNLSCFSEQILMLSKSGTHEMNYRNVHIFLFSKPKNVICSIPV